MGYSRQSQPLVSTQLCGGIIYFFKENGIFNSKIFSAEVYTLKEK